MKLTVKDLAFKYKEKKVFENVDFESESGEFCCIIGPNGAGKSTLLKCINGILKPSGGKVLVDLRDVQDMTLRERARVFGYVPQSTTINPCLNVMETVISGRMPYMNQKASEDDIRKAEEVLCQLHLEEFALRSLHKLSGGERQRILMARAIVQNAPILLFDEPTSNLDIRYQLETMELMREIAHERGLCALAVIHDLGIVLRYADKVLLMNANQLEAVGKPEEVINRENVKRIFWINAKFTSLDKIPVLVPVSSVTGD